MNQIKLSICIATFNRGPFIGPTLESIIAQATTDVEIVIVDGASTDDTQQIVQLCQARFPNLRYFRQEINMGVDRDFATAVDLAQGEYCWLFSDDDLIKPGALKDVLGSLHGQYGLVIANSEVRTPDLGRLLQAKRLRLDADRVYDSSESDCVLADIGRYLTFIGCVILKKSLWETRNKAKYFGSFFIHVGVIFQSPLPEKSLVIAKPLISVRYGNAMWLDKYFEIWMIKWPTLIWSFEHYSDTAKQKVTAREPWRRFQTLFKYRAKHSYSMNAYAKWIRPQLHSNLDRATSVLIACLPCGIANALAQLMFMASRHPDKELELLDLRNSSDWKKLNQRSRQKIISAALTYVKTP